MKRAAVTCFCIAIASLATTAGAATHPTLRVMREAPLTVGGSAFRAHEPLRITATAGDATWRTTVVAGARGGFVVSWTGAKWAPCSTPLVIIARGPKSGTVTRKLPLQECAQQ